MRSLTLTNCDTHDNWPPEAFKPFVEMVKAGGLRDTLNAMLADKAMFRSPGALGPGYERPEIVTDGDIESYLRPLVRTEQRTRDVQRFIQAFDNKYHAGNRTSASHLAGSDPPRLGHGRHLLSGEVGPLARRSNPGREAAGRAQGRAALLPRGAGQPIQ